MLGAMQTNDFEIWLSDSTENNFRYKIWDQYKANRKDAPKPTHYNFLRNILVEKYNANITPEQEADDALGISYTNFTSIHGDGAVICSIDKDLDQIAGNHFNFVKKQFYIVEEWEALKWFYTQCLTGDRTENIAGVEGVGPVKASKILNVCGTEEELFNAVREQYKDDDLFLRNGQLLKIRTQEGEVWQFPEFPQSLSMKQTP